MSLPLYTAYSPKERHRRPSSPQLPFSHSLQQHCHPSQKEPAVPGARKDALQPEAKKAKAEKPTSVDTKPKTASEESSIDRIISYAQDYKASEIDMATVVLSEDMKQVLDKLKTSLPVKTPFKYLLSAIIKEYFETHKQEIRDLILRF